MPGCRAGSAAKSIDSRAEDRLERLQFAQRASPRDATPRFFGGRSQQGVDALRAREFGTRLARRRSISIALRALISWKRTSSSRLRTSRIRSARAAFRGTEFRADQMDR
jgi:hypothetical protein